MSSQLQRLFIVCSVILGMGAHWAILQSFAWTGMVITYSQQSSSFREALQKTFDGKHPCSICKAVNEGRQSERGQDHQKLLLKLDFFIQDVSGQPLFPPALAAVSTSFLDLYRWSKDTPPTPPPLSA